MTTTTLADVMDSPREAVVPLSTPIRTQATIYGQALAWSGFLQRAVGGLVLAVIALCGVVAWQMTHVGEKEFVFVRINELGAAEAVDYHAARTFVPQDRELRHFLNRFVITHFSRLRGAAPRDFSDSLWFLNQSLRTVALEGPAGGERPTKADLDAFTSSLSAEEIDIEIKGTTLTETQKPPYRGTVTFEKQFYQQGSRQVTKPAEVWTAQITFGLKPQVPNAFELVNPLGFEISYFRVDQAYKK